MTPHFALALDIGGSHVTAAVINLTERQLLEKSLVRQSVDEAAPANQLLESWVLAAQQAHLQGGLPDLHHIGIAMPSPFDYRGGISLHEHKFHRLNGLNITEGLKAHWKDSALFTTPVLYGNDADLFVLGEWWNGAAHGAQRVLGVTLGTGLGSGFLEKGRVLTADPRIPPEGELWNTPYQDSIAEDHASGRSIVRHYRQLTSRVCNVLEISTAARKHEPEARQVMDHFGDELGRILSPWMLRFRPDVVLLGGNISRAFDCFEGSLRPHLKGVILQTSTLLEQASLFGCAALDQVSEQVMPDHP